MEGPGDQLREEGGAGQGRRLLGRKVLQRAGRAEQLGDRVVAQEGREEAADRGQLADLLGGRGGTPCA